MNIYHVNLKTLSTDRTNEEVLSLYRRARTLVREHPLNLRLRWIKHVVAKELNTRSF